jgi:glyoxylase-like metal-dependent hydrolase (beta-lactamase superfamily II)
VPGIFLVHLPLPMKPTIVNVYLLRSGDEWALIDTGMNSADSIATFKAVLAQVGCAPEHLRQIICTHHHPDHFGTSKTYKELTGARLYLHRAEYERAQVFLPSERPAEAVRFFLAHGIPLQRFAHVPRPSDLWSGLYVTAAPDVYIDDGDVIRAGDFEIEVVWTPGHAPGHCVMYLRRQRFPGTTGNPLADFLASQRKVQRFDVDLVLPAHGGVFPDHRHRANQIIHHHQVRLQDILDITRRPYQFPATFETLAHLEYLRQAGNVATEEREDQMFWRAA